MSPAPPRPPAGGPPGPAGPDLPRTWRPFLARLVAWGLAGFLVLFSVGGFFVLPASTRAAVSWPQRFTLLFLLAVGAGLLWVVARGRVVATSEGLTVVNMIRTRHLDWPQVVRVRMRPGDPWVQLDLADGTTLPATGIQNSDGERGRRAAAELSAVVEAMTRTERDD